MQMLSSNARVSGAVSNVTTIVSLVTRHLKSPGKMLADRTVMSLLQVETGAKMAQLSSTSKTNESSGSSGNPGEERRFTFCTQRRTGVVGAIAPASGPFLLDNDFSCRYTDCLPQPGGVSPSSPRSDPSPGE